LARNDDGEFELILGNRQLVSVFLIVVILLGVFFSMGYIVGRNSSPSTLADNHSATSGKPIVVDNSPHPATALPEEPTSTPASAPPPEQASPAAEKPSPTQGSTPSEKKAEAPKPVETKPSPAEPAKRTAVGEPPPGMYLQVVATTRADAEIVSESLLKKGFRSMVAPIPDSPLNRVLVGPFRAAAELADARTRLEATGFKPYVRKY
jgi:cell division protein FtsN